MVFSPEDSEALFADFGVPVEVDGIPETEGVLLQGLTAERELGLTLNREECVLLVRPGVLGELEPDQLLTVAGVVYRYRGVAPVAHRRFDHLMIARSVTP